ncbi:hypothetical protein B0H67DRAFT_642402 [Lasiosphaeris hirsuta]|uniref:Uncharacterized protein n=1 Tax=Lasiosphaeris hirsuta TaxID=260670 RepID=A0AA40B1Q6_9PEZI|nr:hypothetical protein B0H67DRAFT_642402 [Lasiosphaeris hirsuta]
MQQLVGGYSLDFSESYQGDGYLLEAAGRQSSGKLSDGSSIVRELKRDTIILNRSAYADLLSTIRDGLPNLESLTATNIELEPERRLRSRIRVLSILRDIPINIYQAIRSSFTCCACKHEIGLRMSTCSVIPGDAEGNVLRDLRLHIALSYEPGSRDPSQLNRILPKHIPIPHKRRETRRPPPSG